MRFLARSGGQNGLPSARHSHSYLVLVPALLVPRCSHSVRTSHSGSLPPERARNFQVTRGEILRCADPMLCEKPMSGTCGEEKWP